MKYQIKQLEKREQQLLDQMICITQWAGPMFCTAQREELIKIREQIAALQGKP